MKAVRPYQLAAFLYPKLGKEIVMKKFVRIDPVTEKEKVSAKDFIVGGFAILILNIL